MKMTQQSLAAMKQRATQIGQWATYLLTETEYWNPKALEQLTEETLMQQEQETRDWLTENRKDYPPMGAEEEARSGITWQVKNSPTALTEDAAFQLEMLRMDDVPLEKLLQEAERLQSETATDE